MTPPPPLTPDALAALRALEQGASPAPWSRLASPRDSHQVVDPDGEYLYPWQGASISRKQALANCELGIALRNAAPALLAAAEERDRLTAQVAALTARLAAYEGILREPPPRICLACGQVPVFFSEDNIECGCDDSADQDIEPYYHALARACAAAGVPLPERKETQ